MQRWPAGVDGQRVEVAGHHFQRTGLGGGNGRHAGAGTEIQYALAAHPLAGCWPASVPAPGRWPSRNPVGRLFEDAPGFFGLKARSIFRIDQPEFEVRAGKGFRAELSITQQFAERGLQGCWWVMARVTKGWPRVWLRLG